MHKFSALKKSFLATVLILALGLILSCKKDKLVIMIPIDQNFYVLSENNLLSFNAKSAKTQLAKIAITGLSTAEKMLDIDFRPATGELYGISSSSKLYVIEPASGIAKAVSTITFTPLLSGKISLDFNPATDQIRMVTSSGQNLRINPENGVVISADGSLGTTIAGIAYQNNYAGAITSTLYAVDPAAKKLLKQETGNSLVQVGDLTLDLGSNLNLDISPDGKNVFAIGQTAEGNRLFQIDPVTGNARVLGTFLSSEAIQGLAIPVGFAAYAIDNLNNLIIFDPTTADRYTKALVGLQTGETVKGMDMRPANGQIYVLSSSNRLLTLNSATGILTLVGSLTTPVSGTHFGFDFNPISDRIRVVSDNGQNLAINPNTAEVTVNTPIDPATATLSAAAYSNNYKSATTTTLYVIDHTTDKLYTQEPNTGVLKELTAIKLTTGNLNIEGSSGFDIQSIGTSNTAFGIFSVAGTSGFYTLELTSGLATPYLAPFVNPITAFTVGLK